VYHQTGEDAYAIRNQLLGDDLTEVSHEQRQVCRRNDSTLAKIFGMEGRSPARLPILRERIRASLPYIRLHLCAEVTQSGAMRRQP